MLNKEIAPSDMDRMMNKPASSLFASKGIGGIKRNALFAGKKRVKDDELDSEPKKIRSKKKSCCSDDESIALKRVSKKKSLGKSKAPRLAKKKSSLAAGKDLRSFKSSKSLFAGILTSKKGLRSFKSAKAIKADVLRPFRKSIIASTVEQRWLDDINAQAKKNNVTKDNVDKFVTAYIEKRKKDMPDLDQTQLDALDKAGQALKKSFGVEACGMVESNNQEDKITKERLQLRKFLENFEKLSNAEKKYVLQNIVFKDLFK